MQTSTALQFTSRSENRSTWRDVQVSSPYISGFGAIGLGDRTSAGGKGASLGELSRVGLPVPAGFVITTRAFTEFMQSADPRGEIASDIEAADASHLDVLAAAAAAARQRVLASSMTPV